jgi:hypothetical protein
MFQYAFGYALAKRHGDVVKVVNVTKRQWQKRDWGLGCFGIYPITNSIQGGIAVTLASLGHRLRQKSVQRALRVLVEDGRHDDERGRCVGDFKPILVSGYWQAEGFFSQQEKAIRKIFSFPDLPLGYLQLSLSRSRPNVAIHVRRGDYVSNVATRNLHLVCDSHWYRAAWEEMLRRVGPAKAFVFSDDPQWALDSLGLRGDVEYISTPDTAPAWIDMSRMAGCDHFIVSNSSYSWWAAYLGAGMDKVVIAPKYWYVNVRTQDLGICPQGWTLL